MDWSHDRPKKHPHPHSCGDVVEEMVIDGVAFRPHHVIYHFHTVFLKNAKSFAGHDGIRIDRTDHDARYAVRKN